MHLDYMCALVIVTLRDSIKESTVLAGSVHGRTESGPTSFPKRAVLHYKLGDIAMLQCPLLLCIGFKDSKLALLICSHL